MNRLFLKSAAVACASVAVSLLLTLIIMPALGVPLSRAIWLTCTVFPLILAWVASATTFWQTDRLKSAHRELARAHAQLATAHRRLSEKASRDDMTGMLNRESFFLFDTTANIPQEITRVPSGQDVFGFSFMNFAFIRKRKRKFYQTVIQKWYTGFN